MSSGGAVEIESQRLIGRVGSAEPGEPLLVVIAGLHGNEPAGVRAAERVLAALAASQIEVRGELVALRGNVRALAQGRRFLHRDLNRGWTRDAVDALRNGGAASGAGHAEESRGSGDEPPRSYEPRRVASDELPRVASEDLEQRELITTIDALAAQARGPRVCIDLHTTSADGIPFVIVGEHRAARDLALEFGLPVVGGLFGSLRTVMMEYLWNAGFQAFAVEGGQNDRSESIDHHEAILWIALATLGMIRPGAAPDLETRRRTLAHVRGELPHLMHVHHRHALRPDDQFRMEPGFANLQRVEVGQLLAHDRNGEIRAPESGVLVMPLYQSLGDDGFFLGREIAS